MDRIFKRRANEEEKEEIIEVEQISFSSFPPSRDESDLYMSARESPRSPSSQSLQDSQSALKLYSKHRDSSDNENDAVSHVEELINRLQSISSQPDEDIDSFIASLSSISDLSPLPPVVGDEPYWTENQEILRKLRQTDSEVSKDLEECNVAIYATDLALKVIEEARWINEVSKDPILSRLVHEIDPKFPLAVRHADSPPRENSNDSTIANEEPTSYDLPEIVQDNALFYINHNGTVHNEELNVRSSRDGVDDFVLKRKKEPCWSSINGNIVKRAFLHDSIREERVSQWTSDAADSFNKLLCLPTSSTTCSEILVDGHEVVLRGSSEWAPPRDQWIFTTFKQDNHKLLLEQQKFRCAGCGVKLENEYMKRVQYCDYYGRIFCQICHQGSKSTIPARILTSWNFSEFPVSDRAFRFLTHAWCQPAIHMATLAPQLITRVNSLKKVIDLREKLGHMWEFIRKCDVAEETVTKHGNLKTMFASMEQYLLATPDLFSLSDLVRVNNKDLLVYLEPIVYYGKCHIESCEKCKELAFVCEICGDATDVLFPYQSDKIHRCPGCGSASHLKCEKKKKKLGSKADCQKCVRLERANRERNRMLSFGD